MITLRSHKLVLSASSQFFKSILMKNPHSHPLLYLSGVDSTSLGFVLDYIYQGEVQIYQENLDRFLTVAERFKLEGLINLPDNNKQEEEKVYQTLEESASALSPTITSGHRQNSQAKRIVKPETETVMVDIDLGGDSNLEEVEAKISENILRENDGTFSCKLCGKSGVKTRQNIKSHVETHMEGLSFPCQNCGKTFRSRNNLNVHMHRNHR